MLLRKLFGTGEDKGGSGCYGDVAATGSAEAVGIDAAIFCNDCPVAFAYFDGFGVITAVEHEFNLLPLVAVGIVLYGVAYQIGFVDFVKHDIAGDFIGSAHAECRVLFAQSD